MKHVKLFASIFFITSFFSTRLAQATEVELYAQLPSISDISISPDGEHLAFILHKKDQVLLAVTKWPPSKAKQAPVFYSIGKKTSADWVGWANKNRIFLGVSRKEMGLSGTLYTATSIMTATLTERKMKPLIRGQKYTQFLDQIIHYLPDDPKHVLMSIALDHLRDGGYAPNVYKVNVDSGHLSLVLNGNQYVHHWFSDQSGAVRGGTGTFGSKGEYYLQIRPVLDNKNHRNQWLHLRDLPGLNGETVIFGFGEDPNTLLVGSNHETETLALYIYDLQERKFTQQLFHNKNFDISTVRFDRDNRPVAAVVIKDEPQSYYFNEKNTETPIQKVEAKMPGYRVQQVTQTRNSSTIIFHIQAPDDPGGIYYYNTIDDTLNKLLPLYPGLSLENVGMVVSAHYRSQDGTKIPAFVTLPPDIYETAQIKNLPFVILPHGGPHSRDFKRFDFLAQAIAAKGYAVLQMNFRGSTGYGKTFKQSGIGEWGTLMQSDIDDGAKWLVSKGYADPKRICIVGGSYGGYAALMGAIKSPDIYACAASLAGVTDIDSMINDMSKYVDGKAASKKFVGKLWKDLNARRNNSPVRQAEKISIPVFLAHGTKDEVVHFDHFTRMRRALNKSNADASFVVLRDGDHHLSKYVNRLTFLKELDVFLDKHLGPTKKATSKVKTH